MDHIKIMIIFFSSFFFTFCINNSVNKQKIISGDKFSINDWIRDSTGCLHLRSFDLLSDLVAENKLIGKSKNDFIQVFGKPNEVEKRDSNQLFLVYYLNSICIGDKLTPDSDKTKVKFKFISNRLVELPLVFEVE